MNDLGDRLADLRIDRVAERPRRRGWIWALAGVAAVVLAFAFWPRGGRAAEVEVVVARAPVAGGGGSGSVLDASGYVTARRQAVVSSKVTGKVEAVFVEEGLVVSEGDLLARIDSSMTSTLVRLAEAELAQAEEGLAETRVRLREAELDLGRARRLREEGVESEERLDRAVAARDALAARLESERRGVEVARAALEVRRQELADTEIRAPFAGVVVSKDAQPGEMISPVSAGGGFTRTGICTLVDMRSLEIEVDVNEAYIDRVTPGQPVRATLDAYPEWAIAARVIAIIPTADRQKATVEVRIALDRGPEGELDPRILPDMGVRVAFLEEVEATTGQAPTPDRPRGVVVPATALRGADGAARVLVVAAGRVESRAVELGARTGDEVAVVAGLEPGERVVVDGPDDLAAGDRVEEVAP